MNREQKKQAIQDLKESFQKASITLLADYSGLKANDMNLLRQQLRESEAKVKVIKNTLAKVAIADTDWAALGSHFQGTIAMVTSEGDPVSAAKALVKFAKDLQKPEIKVGFMSGEIMEASQVEALSKLPSREELLAKLLGSLQSPAQNLVNVLVAIPRQLVTVLAAIRDQKS